MSTKKVHFRSIFAEKNNNSDNSLLLPLILYIHKLHIHNIFLIKILTYDRIQRGDEDGSDYFLTKIPVFLKNLPPRRDSISQPAAPISSMAGGDDTTGPQGHIWNS
jgi:hypothetical protein